MRAITIAAVLLPLAACGETETKTPEVEAVAKSADGYEIAVTNIQVGSKVDDNGLVPEASAGELYVLITYSLTNTGDAQQTMGNWPEVLLIDQEGNEYERDLFASSALSSFANSSWAAPLSPDLSTSVTAVWKVSDSRFDRSTWKVKFASTPEVTFGL